MRKQLSFVITNCTIAKQLRCRLDCFANTRNDERQHIITKKKPVATLFILTLTFLLLCALTLPTATWSLTAQANRSILEEGESLELLLTLDPRNHGTHPDLTPLKNDFDILSTGRSQQMSIINGKKSSTIQWIINLSPKHTGKLTIPAITLGNERSQPIPIEVLTAQGNRSQQRAKNIFIETSVTPKTAYVQSQLHYTTKLFYATNIVEGSLTPPNMDSATIKRLSEDIHYETQRNNQHYEVIERHYAIFPQSSGPLEIQAPTFSGQIAVRSNMNTMWGSLLQNTQPIRVHGKTTVLNIQAQPSQFKGQTWLPAKKLTLQTRLSNNKSQWLAGDARTLTIIIRAEGLTAAQLPEITLENINNVNTYPDQAELTDSIEHFALIGTRRQNIAIVPTGDGIFMLPAIRIAWWNTNENKTMHAQIPARKFTIIANSQQRNEAPTIANETTPTKIQAVEAVNNTALNKKWFIAIIICLLGWLATIIIWQWSRIKKLFDSKQKMLKDKIPQPKLSELTKIIHQACLLNDAKATRKALLAWANQQLTQKSFRNITDLNVLTNDPNCLQALQALDKACYSQSNWDGRACWDAVMILWHQQKTKKRKRHTSPLKPLYPKT